jgi:hypothetical protein
MHSISVCQRNVNSTFTADVRRDFCPIDIRLKNSRLSITNHDIVSSSVPINFALHIIRMLLHLHSYLMVLKFLDLSDIGRGGYVAARVST